MFSWCVLQYQIVNNTLSVNSYVNATVGRKLSITVICVRCNKDAYKSDFYSYQSSSRRKKDFILKMQHAGHGMEWNGKEISVWNMEDAEMEWNERFQEWNGRQSSILPYQFHTRFRTWHLQENFYG